MTAAREATDLDLYELAWLAGGPARVTDTALVALVRSGRVRVHAPGALATVRLTRRHAVEAAVLDAIGPSGHRSADTVHWRIAGDDRILAVGRGLQRDGFVVRLRLGGRRRSVPPHVLTRAGRRALRQRRADVTAGGEELQVALGGREALSDAGLRTSIFAERRPVPKPPPVLDFADGPAAASRTRASIVADANRLGPWMGS